MSHGGANTADPAPDHGLRAIGDWTDDVVGDWLDPFPDSPDTTDEGGANGEQHGPWCRLVIGGMSFVVATAMGLSTSAPTWQRTPVRAGTELEAGAVQQAEEATESEGVALRWARVRKEMARLCRASEDERFEDGMESAFSRALVAAIQTDGDAAVGAIDDLIKQRAASREALSEALRRLGLMEGGPSYAARRRVLEDALFSSSPTVRDGAALGLASLDDPRALVSLRAAAGAERLGWVREGMEQVIYQLEQG